MRETSPKLDHIQDCFYSSQDNSAFKSFLVEDLGFEIDQKNSADEIVEMKNANYSDIQQGMAIILSRLQYYKNKKNVKLLVLLFYSG